MGFDRTQGSIKTLSSQRTITADQLLDMMVNVALDVRDYNGIKSIADITLSDDAEQVENLVDCYCSLTDVLLRLGNKNMSRIQAHDAEALEDMKETEKKLQEIQPQMNEVNRHIEEAKA